MLKDTLEDQHVSANSTMNYYLSLCLTILYWLVFPVVYILRTLLSFLLLVLSPLVYLAHYIAYGLWYPFSLIPNFEVGPHSTNNVLTSTDIRS